MKLDLPTLLFSNRQICFLESMTALSKIGDFSPDQIAAMEKLIYEFQRLSSNYQFAEDSRSVSQRFMQSNASLIEATKQYRAERERIEAREARVRENSMKIEAEIKHLEQKLKAINSEIETLISKKLELASQIDDKSAELAKSSAELDTWIRQRKAVEERETILATWELFRKLFLYTDDALKVSPASSAEVVQRQETCSIPEDHQPGVKCEMEPSPSAPDEAPANRKSHQVYSHKSTEVQNQVDRDSRMWYHFSSSGVPQGPLSASLLKSWCESSPYAAKLKVWKTGQTPEQAIPIADAILQFFP
uniref:GYF domain-containing protein n=1 Tax=Kalanchoe fedtschenkoi TaxID=63787 RepID=A0A7N0UBQ6_KALFE